MESMEQLHQALQIYFHEQGRTIVIAQPEYQPFNESKTMVYMFKDGVMCPAAIKPFVTELNLPLAYYRLDLVTLNNVVYINEITVMDCCLWLRDVRGCRAGIAIGLHLVKLILNAIPAQAAQPLVAPLLVWPLPHPTQDILRRRLPLAYSL